MALVRITLVDTGELIYEGPCLEGWRDDLPESTLTATPVPPPPPPPPAGRPDTTDGSRK